jgi:hypothetical protein
MEHDTYGCTACMVGQGRDCKCRDACEQPEDDDGLRTPKGWALAGLLGGGFWLGLIVGAVLWWKA